MDTLSPTGFERNGIKMYGRKVEFIPVGGGDAVRTLLYFTFGYCGKNYAVFLNDDNNYGFIDVAATGRGEFTELGESFNVKRIQTIMQMIAGAARKNPEAYPMDGCHYAVTDTTVGGKASFKVTKTRALDDRFKGSVQVLSGENDSIIMKAFGVIARIAICIAAILLFVLLFKDEWIGFFLPSFFEKHALLTYFIVEAIIAVGFCFIHRSFRQIKRFAIVAFLALFFFSALGTVITSGVALRCTMTLVILIVLAYYALGVISTSGLTIPTAEALVAPLKSCAAVLVLSFIIVANLVSFMLGVEAPLAKITEKERDSIETSYTSALGVIHPNQWKITDEKSRVSALQNVTDKVCAVELGCYVPTLRVSAEGETVDEKAKYSDETREIVVNSHELRNAESSEMIKAVLSECRKAWQYYVDEMYDSISDTIDKAYLGLETFRHAVEIDKDFRNGAPAGGYAETDRKVWTEEFYKENIERFILYRNGVIPETPIAPAVPVTPDADSDLQNSEETETTTASLPAAA